MLKRRLTALIVLAIGVAIGWFVYSSQITGSRPFKLGLDLSGGTQLTYRAKLDAIQGNTVADSMSSLRDTIERRVNLFGVSEPIVQTEHGGTLAGTSEERLIVELPGVTDTQKAIDLIGQTPVLEFRMLKAGATPPETGVTPENVNELFEPASITGRHLTSAQIQFNQSPGGIPVPVEVAGAQTVSGTLGGEAVARGISAGLWGVGLVALFMVIWDRFPGAVSVVALALYVVAILALFKLIPVTLTAAGIAAFILSIGMAVDANVLIFERTREELENGKSSADAIHDGFARAWPSIRDSNIASMITAVILFWFGASLIKGFALVFGLGVLVSMLTAISVSRTFLLSLDMQAKGGFTRFIFGSGTSL